MMAKDIDGMLTIVSFTIPQKQKAVRNNQNSVLNVFEKKTYNTHKKCGRVGYGSANFT